MKMPTLLYLGIAALFMALAAASQYGLSWKTMVPIIISLFSLLVSFYNLWLTKLSPLDLYAGIGGRVYLFRDNTPRVEPLVKLPVTLANSGAIGGFVDDLAVEIQRKGSSAAPIIFACKYEEVKQSIHMGPPSTAPAPMLIPFQGVFLKGAESMTKILGFVPYYDDLTKQSSFEYELGEYTVTLLTRLGNQAAWQRHGTIDFKIDELDIQALRPPQIPEGGGHVVLYERAVFSSQRAHSLRMLIEKKSAGN